MWFGVISLFPDMFAAIRDVGMTGRAINQGLIQLETWNPRDFTTDNYRRVDERPYGGGPGMVMLIEPLAQAIAAAKARAASLGIDERLIQRLVDAEWSIGDYVLSGGELPAMVMIDAISRRIDGVLGHQQSAEQDSFATGLLDCPHYTRPEVYDGDSVPAVLLSGHHADIQRWRWRESLKRTLLRRPDLLDSAPLNAEQRRLLAQLKKEQASGDLGQSNS